MRQAGRALPEYRALKKSHTFLQLVQTPELAAEVTLQPVQRFAFDAAILFSDILVVPEAMGQPYHFRDGGGIEMDFTLDSAAEIEKLRADGIRESLNYVAEALALIKAGLPGRQALLGFAGSPWTLANFMVEGGSAREYTRARLLHHTDPQLFNRLLAKITEAVIEFLHLQIDAGVDAVQIFDSLGGSLPGTSYMQASGRWIRDIIKAIDRRVPVIVFPKGVHGQWRELSGLGANVLGADWTVSLPEVRGEVPEHIGLQGNLDPCLLTTTPEIVARETECLLREMRGSDGFIFNLGHGVPPNAKLECIESLVNTVQNSR